MLAVACRSEAVLLPLIKQWIEPGTLIISDCWKSYYVNLENHGYKHCTVNHSVEFVNGQHTNKVEELWLRRAYQHLVLDNFNNHLVEFIWGHMHIKEMIYLCVF